MKINRYRKVHRILRFYSHNFGFRKPYQILIDGTICVAALKHKINIEEQFSKYLDGDVKLLTTQCIVTEVERLGSATFGALLIVKKFGIHQCGHGKSPTLASECILHMIGQRNSSRYIIATQDRDLQGKCRQIQGVPLLYLHLKSPTLEAPTDLTKDLANENAKKNFKLSEYDKEKLNKFKADVRVNPGKGRKRKVGGPNPLSCKKKKKKTENNEKPKNLNKNNKKKRKRNRNRLLKKIKHEILTSLHAK